MSGPHSTHILTQLQHIDSEITRLKAEIDTLPEKEQILKLRKQRAAIEEKAEQGENMYRSLDGEIKAFEARTQELNDAIGKLQEQTQRSGDHRSIEAITHEMDSFKHQIEDIETSELSLMEKREKVHVAQEQIEDLLAKASAREEGLIEDYKSKGTKLTNRINELAQERAELVSGLDKDLYRRYRELLETKHGIAVAGLEHDTCTVCRVTLSGAQLDIIRNDGDISTCPSCQRIMIAAR